MKHQTLDQRLQSYGLTARRKNASSCKLAFTASAVAGVGMMLIPPPAEASIVYSGAQNGKEVKVISGVVQTQTVDLNGDGNAEFTFGMTFSSTSFNQKLAVSSAGTARVIKNNTKPARLDGNYTVSSLKVFDAVNNDDLASAYDNGNFRDKQGFLGVKFTISNETHFGWIQYKANSDASVGTILDWAYENIPGRAIRTGDTNSFNWNLFLPAIFAGGGSN